MCGGGAEGGRTLHSSSVSYSEKGVRREVFDQHTEYWQCMTGIHPLGDGGS